MSDQKKRITPLPVSSNASGGCAPGTPRPRPAGTIRLRLHLAQSTERDCPEFNYKDLIAEEETRRKAEKEKRKGNAPNGLWDPFSDNDEDVERIAKQFEQKYGSSNTYGKSKGRNKQDDYADIGAGYDENDSFIDNTDGYDEIIPPECDTACGGFYINSGSLEFKNVPGAVASTGEGAAGDSSPPTDRKSHKRPLSSSESEDESSSSDEDTESSVVDKPTENNMKNIKSTPVTDSDKSGEDGKQSKPEKIKEDLPRKKRKSSQEGSASSGQETITAKKSTKPTPNTTVENNEGSSDSHSSIPPSSDNHASSDSSRDTNAISTNPTTTVTTSVPVHSNTLPQDLPTDVVDLIQRLKSLADNHFSSRTGKLSGPEVNEIILELETKCKRNKMSSGIRRDVYAYAAQLLRRSKAGLVQMARKLAEEHQRNTTNSSPVEKLKDIINKMKPSLLESYRIESQKIVEINKQIVSQNATLDDDKKIQERRLPKRRFPWNDVVRSLLSDIIRSRGLDVSDTDENTVRFLQTDIFPLFPTGFVRFPTLLQQVKNSKLHKSPNDSTSKKAINKHVDSKQINPQLNMKLKPVDLKSSEGNDKMMNVNETENFSLLKPKQKSQSATLSVTAESSEQPQDITKISDILCFKSDSKVIDHEKIQTNSEEIDKNKSFKVNSTNTSLLSGISDSISVSITSVFPKKCDNENASITSVTPDKYQSLVDTVIMQSLEKHQSLKSNNDFINPSSSPQSVIKSVESVSPNTSVSPNSMVGSVKVKPTSSLLGKNTIAKIISSKNTSSDILSKYSLSDNLKTKTYCDPSKAVDKIASKSLQDGSYSTKRVKNNNIQNISAQSMIQTHTNAPMLKSPNNQSSKSVSTLMSDNFVKPQFKTDHIITGNKMSNVSSNNYTHQSKFKDMSVNGNQKESDKNIGLNDLRSRSTDFTHISSMVEDNSPSQKQYRSKHLDEPVVPNFMTVTQNTSEDQKKTSTKTTVPYYKMGAAVAHQRNPVLNVDDSSSDDCVEVLTDEERLPKKSFLKATNDQLNMSHYEKYINAKEKFNKSKAYSTDVTKVPDKSNRDRWSSNTMPLNAHGQFVNQNEHSVKVSSIKKCPSYAKTDFESKKPKYDPSVQIVVEEDPFRDVVENASTVISVIKDAPSIKSEKTLHPVPDNSSVHFEKDKDIIMDQDLDVSRVMQDLKELQNLQMRSDGNHQRLYDDPGNNICRSTSYSETDNKLYTKYKEGRENMMASKIHLAAHTTRL